MRDLGTLGGGSIALSINDAGQVAGYFQATGDKSHAFITGPDGKGMRDLSTLGGSESSASGINNAGQVVGGSYIAENRHFHAFITGADGMGMRDLGTFAGQAGFSTARSINDAGQVVGESSGEGAERAFITGPDGMGMRDLGASGSLRSANDINDAGQVVGQDGNGRAFITGPNGMGVRDLGTFGGMFPFNSSEALGINDTGQVVGKSFATVQGLPAFHAFVTGPDGTGMMDLNSLVDPPQGLIFSEARAINNAGQVIASASTPPIPESEMPALFLAGLCLIGFMARPKKAKNPG